MNDPMQNPGQLKSFPNADELTQLQRRLTFHPSAVSDPKILTREQIAAYNKDGYIMKFVAGSHHFGHLTYRLSESAEQSVLAQTVDDPERFGAVIYDELRAGQISLHSDLLLHGSEQNNSARRRCGLTLRYCSSDVSSDPRYNWHKEGVLLSGSDPAGNWLNPARPARDYDVG